MKSMRVKQAVWFVWLALLATYANADCVTLAQSNLGSWDDVLTTGNLAGPANPGTSLNEEAFQKNATKFTASASYTVCAVSLPLFSYVTVHPTNYYHSLKVGIWSHNAGSDEPNALVGTASDSVPASTVPSCSLNALASCWNSTANVTFSNMSASLTSGTTYWIVLEASPSPLAATNYPVAWKSTGTAGLRKGVRVGGSAWFDYPDGDSDTGQFQLLRE
jgi:hypothetical protein